MPIPAIAAACAFFLILALLPLSSAADYPAGMKLFGYYAVPEGSAFSIENFTYMEQPAYAIVSAGEIYAILLPNFPFVMPEPIADKKELESALYSYYLSRGNSPRAIESMSQIHAGIKSISSVYDKGEDKCRILLGTDRSECFDFESCQKACYTVTSFCQPVALGTGRDFIGHIGSFENSSRQLNRSYALEEEAYAALAENASQQNALAYLSSIEGINRAATASSQSPLFTWYSYCFSPDYSLPIITNLQVSAQKYYLNASPFYSLPSSAEEVQNRTLAGIERKRKAELPPFQPPKGNNTSANNTSQGMTERELADEEVKQAYLSQAIIPVALIIGAIFMLGAALIFYAFFLRKKKSK